jgi:predicted AlkP superfamily pyrophosphatase or phosphodiesterase
MTKVALVIMDGAGYDSVVSECGYLEGAVTLGQARRWKMHTATPSLSGPMYETIHTGLWPHEHGIVSNEAVRRSSSSNIFSLARAAGKTTGAVAQEYFHRLYIDEAWDQLRSVEHQDENAHIQYARFYSMEGYGSINAVAPAEIDLCAQTTLLMERHAPDYMLLHTCSADTLGHTYGGDSKEYRRQIWHIDNALSRAIPVWRKLGYDIIVTADHGMTADHWHGGTTAAATEIPFYLFSDAMAPAETEELSQLGIAASVLALLGIEAPEGMREAFITPKK